MTVRENVHQLVDTLPDDQLRDVLDYLAEISDSEEVLGADALAGVEEGREDLKSGRTISLVAFRRKYGFEL